MLKEAKGNLLAYSSEIGRKIASLFSEIDICLIWSRGLPADLHRRPMIYEGVSIENGLWFFLSADSHLVELYRDSLAVTAAVSNPTTKKCAALAGRSSIVNGKEAMSYFTTHKNSAIFPVGIQPASLVLLKIDIDQMDFWEWPGEEFIHSTVKLESFDSSTDQKWPHDFMSSP